jgi:hypothetical protein
LTIELYTQEEKGDNAESRRHARAEFLKLIPEVKPACISDLSRAGFLEFVYVVCERFQAQLLSGSNRTNLTGKHVFISLLFRAFQKIATDGLLNQSIGDLLCLTFAQFHVIDAQTLEREFPSYEQVQKIDSAQTLCRAIREWSTKWQLDAEWCREHAFGTLRNTLSDDSLKWSLLASYYSPFLRSIYSEAISSDMTKMADSSGLIAVLSEALVTLQSDSGELLDRGWQWAAQEITHDLLWSRVRLNVNIHGNNGDPKPFHFKWKDIDFMRPGYNPLAETQTQYKRRLEVEFRLLLNERERAVLISLRKDESKPYLSAAINSGLLQRFRERLDKHITAIINRTAKRTRELVRIKKRTQFSRNLKWTIDYQLYPGCTLAEIAKGTIDQSVVAKAIDDALGLLDLTKRKDAKRGRKSGRINKYPKFLSRLAR